MPQLVVLMEQLLAPVPGGTGRYSRELAHALVATAPPGWTVGSAIARHSDPSAAVVAGVDGPTILPLPRRALAAAWDAGTPLWPGGDTVHAPTPLAPPAPRRGSGLVVTVHDTVPWTHPETLSRRGAKWHRRVITRAARRADALIVPTKAVAAELSVHAPGPARVHVVGEGVTSSVSTPPEPERASQVANQLDLPPRYVLAMGTLEPRKGLDVLLAALASAHAPGIPLVVVGQQGWGAVNPVAAARHHGLEPGQVKMLGKLSDADLSVVLHRAAVLAVPSLAEGFGLPMLEAMAAGVPVVHSDVPALVEVAAGAGITVKRHDPAALAAALRLVLSDRNRAAEMVAEGRRRAQQFTWERTARQIWDVHVQLLRTQTAGKV